MFKFSEEVTAMEITLSIIFSAVGALIAFLISNAKFQERLEQLTKRYEATAKELAELKAEKDRIMLKVQTRDEEMKYIHSFIEDSKASAIKHDTLQAQVTELQTEIKYMQAALNRIEQAVGSR